MAWVVGRGAVEDAEGACAEGCWEGEDLAEGVGGKRSC